MGKYKHLSLLLFVLAAFTLALSKAASWHIGYGFRLPEAVVPDAKSAPAPVQKRRGRRAEPPEPRVVMGKLEAHLVSSRQHTAADAASLVELKDGCTSDTLLAKPADCGRRCNAPAPAPEGCAPPCRGRTSDKAGKPADCGLCGSDFSPTPERSRLVGLKPDPQGSAPPCRGRLRAFWFSGSREGAADVTIHSAIFDPAANTWWREQEVAGRESTQRGLHRTIAKVGNPVAVRAANGELWLLYVTVSPGGWGGSSITLMTSSDEGEHWNAPRRLITSPFINLSTLVKSAPFFYADGTMGLPVYHEFISKFSEILRLDHSGKVIDKQRLAAGGQGTLQPVVLVRSEQEALVLNRYSGKDADKRVVAMASDDGGRHWQVPHKHALRNPDAALTALALEDGRMLAVLNDQEQGRASLSLQLSEDGGTSWHELHRLEEMNGLRDREMSEGACLDVTEKLLRSSDPLLRKADAQKLAPYVESARPKVVGGGSCHFEFSYPYMIQTRNGDIHLAYTWNRTFIKHVRIDARWLKNRLDANDHGAGH